MSKLLKVMAGIAGFVVFVMINLFVGVIIVAFMS